MKELPILVCGQMVRPILEGRKTHTRRVVKVAWSGTGEALLSQSRIDPAYKCPYGQPGDRLWVRETWGYSEDLPDGFQDGRHVSRRWLRYRADGEAADVLRWKPSIHMPRWASRITLEVVAVRVERLQDISEEDAQAEGIELAAALAAFICDTPAMRQERKSAYRSAFVDLWQSINGPGSWEQNPLVWVVEFRRVWP